MQKPDVDEIIGLSPAISIDQKSRSNNPRSTVATITEIYDYLRVLYARIGRPHCLVCGDEIKKLSNEEIKNFILEKVNEQRVKMSSQKVLGSPRQTSTRLSSKISLPFPAYLELWAPVVRGRKGEYYQLLYDMLGKGYTEAIIDGKRQSLRERIDLPKNKRHDISVLVDSININDFVTEKKNTEERLAESLEHTLNEAGYSAIFYQPDLGDLPQNSFFVITSNAFLGWELVVTQPILKMPMPLKRKILH
jgi:excinuclease ABC subunit A